MINSDLFRRAIVLCSLLFFISFLKAEQTFTTIHTSGNSILNSCGDTITIRGVNYAPYDWGYDNTQLLLDQVAQSGANAVRMSWYATTTAPYYTDDLLDTAIARCIANNMIAIIELHDITCDATTADVEPLAAWYAARASQLNSYHSGLIINIANETGFVNWASNSTAAQAAYIAAYDSAINTIRNAGIDVPLMIDAPDCGTSIDILSNVAASIIASDPKHNIIFSTHAYWYAYANNDSTTMQQDIAAAVSHNFPFIIGEAANYQDSTDNNNNTYYCTWALNYPALLNICKQQKLGWLVWSWNNDNCASRQLSSDGSYANLTTYGMDIVNNPSYGLRNVATPVTHLNGAACATTGINDITDQKPYLLYNDNGAAYLKSLSTATMQLQQFDILGRLLQQTEITPGQTLPLNNTNMGVVRVTNCGSQYTSRFVSVQ